MAAVKTFIEEKDLKNWVSAFKLYDEVLQEKAKSKSKANAGKEFLILEKWFQNELPEMISDREQKYISGSELVKIMKWKLSRGKFRPKLLELAGSNDDAVVKKFSKDAFEKLNKENIKGAIECLSKLKGVGPATASAILTAGSPDKAAFMADESTLAILGEGSLKYNVQEYLVYMDGVTSCVNDLNQKSKSSEWTPHKVELTLWTYYMASKMQPKLIDCLKRKKDARCEGESTSETTAKKKSKT